MNQRINIDTSIVGGYFDSEFAIATKTFINRLENAEIILVLSDLLFLELIDVPSHSVYQKQIDDLEELKKSTLLKAFAGELRGGELVELQTEESRRDDKIIKNRNNRKQPNPEGVK